ncbi:MAG: peptide chain release factor N(5)-glutamine methyltransferase [Salinisphaera sp.]|jgi:release factor glutamine methyltransferase|nr:peptide chain release factor N(5)-glutamine methyltransferase [Salinisphaera sp.]
MNRNLDVLRREAAARLADVSDAPDIDARRLLEHATGLSATQLIVNGQRAASDDERQRFDTLLTRRLTGEPLAYIIGTVGFHELILQVSPDVLIPRPDTETLVELALARLDADAPLSVVDLGTGSGAIALALAHARPRWQLLATDASFAALDCAQHNARRLRLDKVQFIQGQWLSALATQRFDAIVSNPPYIDPHDRHLLDAALGHEPRHALVAEDGGLADLRRIVRAAPYHLRPGGRILLEHGCDQGPAVRAMLGKAGLDDVATHHDLGGRPRVSVGLWHGGRVD